MPDLHQIARTLVSGERGILAADESIKTMSSRLEAEGIAPTEGNRRDYRELLLTAPELSATVSGIILSEETFRQSLSSGQPFPVAARELGVLPGIKVDTGTEPYAGAVRATVTCGLDGLPARLEEYAALGAAFAKWRAVIDVTDLYWRALEENAVALAEYARACQRAGIVPIVEPEVLCSGDHDIAASADATTTILGLVFDQLAARAVDLRGIVLKPNMVTPGLDSAEAPMAADAVAEATLAVLRATVPAEVPGIAFLSGGHGNTQACGYLAAINEAATDAPWQLTYSFGRALVSDALHTWAGDPVHVDAAQAQLLANCQRASSSTRRPIPA